MSADHEPDRFCCIGLDIIAVLMPVHVLQAIAQRLAACQLQQLLVNFRHRHAQGTAKTPSIPMSEEEHDGRLGLHEVIACLCEVGKHVCEQSCSRKGKEADVPELVINQEVGTHVLKAGPGFPNVGIDGEVHEIHVVLRWNAGGNRVSGVVLHLPNAKVVVLVTAARTSTDPNVVVAIHHKHEPPLDIWGESVEESRRQLSSLVVEVVAQDREHVHARVRKYCIEHGYGILKSVEDLCISAANPF
mmetsp:Transcript_4597/g.11038  ORF Transcript_4597/g.11038 Transcript_4597/m.11038 type:complete len:245 (+) Transcript_4597:275-1009(+)